jgi:DNA repair protein RecO (recombination protein O)
MSHFQRVNLQPAYVLHQHAYRDTSAIIELFTPEHGRVVVMARGLKSPKSKWRGIVRPFQPLLVSWTGRGEMGTLTVAEAQGRALRLEAEMLACGFYVNELLVRLLHKHDPHLELFSDYDATLRELAAADKAGPPWPVQACLRHFEIRLIGALGYALMLDKESGSRQAVRAEALYDYTLEEGPVLVSVKQQPESFAVRVQGKTLLALAQQTLSQTDDAYVFREARQLMRVVLDHYLGHRPLNSRQLFAAQRRMTVSTDHLS